MIINHNRRFIFLHIPKTAGTSITAWLSVLTGWNDIELGGSEYGEQIQAIYSPRFKLQKHSPAADVRRIIGDELWRSYFKFAVVRHPLDRLVSAYRFYRQWDHPGVAEVRELDTLEAFLRSPFFARDHRNATRATGSQARFLVVGDGAEIDMICRFERLAEDMAAVATHIGVEPPTLPRVNETRRRPLETYFTPETRHLARSIYAEDFRLLGYHTDKDLPINFGVY